MIENKTKSGFTTSYQYSNTDEEHIFSCKGRPFGVLISNRLPTPVSNLIDYNLVKELGLKMSNMQFRKLCFAGHKMRILGRVSTGVQCIQDGKTNGGFHLKGLVVTNLDQNLDTTVIASAKMRGNILKTSSKLFNERKCSTEDSDGVNSDTSESDTSEDSDVLTPGKGLTEDSNGVNSDTSESDSEDSDVLTPWEVQLSRHLMYPSKYPRPDGVSSGTTEKDSFVEVQACQEAGTSTMSPRPASSSSMMSSTPMVSSSLTPSYVRPPQPSPITRNTTTMPSSCVAKCSSSITTTTSTSGASSARVSSSTEQAQSSYPSKLPILAYRDPNALNYWSQAAEYGGLIINQSDRDGKPRITNISEGHLSRKLRVGVWSHLDDPAGHEARHVVLANLRKAAPDRVCQLCSYNLLHNCSLTDFGATQHCSECCSIANRLQKSKITREYKEALSQM